MIHFVCVWVLFTLQTLVWVILHVCDNLVIYADDFKRKIERGGRRDGRLATDKSIDRSIDRYIERDR